MATETPKLQDRDWLYEQYVVQARSAVSIAEELGCDRVTVYRWLRRYDIEVRRHSSRYPQLNDKEWLRKQYVDEGKSTHQIAEEVGTTPGNVYAHLKTAGIPIRDPLSSLPRGEDGRVVRRPSGTRAASIRKTAEAKRAAGNGLAGAKHHRWKGGRIRDGKGYIRAYAPEHPRATTNNPYVYEHILVLEEKLGRYLDPNTEIAHHINHVKDDNRPDNIELKQRLKHTIEHWEKARRAAQVEEALRAENELLREKLASLDQRVVFLEGGSDVR